MEDQILFKEKFFYVLQELEIDASDYEYRRAKREQYEKKHRQYGFLRLELLNYIKSKIPLYKKENEPRYTGNVYGYEYIRKTNPKCKYYNKILDSNLYSQINAMLILADKDAKCDFIKKYNAFHKCLIPITELEPYMNAEFIRDFIRNPQVKYRFDDWRKETSDYKDIQGFDVKIKKIVKKLDYSQSYQSYFSISNLKYWNKHTHKTSNKGLTAFNMWSYENENHRRAGWSFGGIKVGCLEDLCINNGFKKEKGTKYQYGDYAEWYLHILE
jgi:hypothetical protein